MNFKAETRERKFRKDRIREIEITNELNDRIISIEINIYQFGSPWAMFTVSPGCPMDADPGRGEIEAMMDNLRSRHMHPQVLALVEQAVADLR